MSYRVEQKIKGRIYVYEVECYWDKEKKQPRQKRKYLGPKEKIYNQPKISKKEKYRSSNFISKSYGDIFLIQYLQDELGISALLKKVFQEDYQTMLALSSFMLQENSPSYLFPYWHDEHYLLKIDRLNSQQLSSLYEKLGRCERECWTFLKYWGKHLSPTDGIYYDITSISSYSDQIDWVEWGYNRDKEILPQINIGLTHCLKTSLPLSYHVHPGSIVDVSTLKNTIKRFELFELSNMFYILDRGFCSITNLLAMHQSKMRFIQPLSFRLKKAKALALSHKKTICSAENAMKYQEEILYYAKDKIIFEEITFNAHLFYNEKLSIDYKHHLYKAILELEEMIKDLDSEQARDKFFSDSIPNRYRRYFRQDKKGLILRDQIAIDEDIFFSGVMIFVVDNMKDIQSHAIIEYYRNRDRIEKEINTLKNYIDGKRIRAHHQDTANGRLFIKFLALIIYTKIVNVIKKDSKLKHYSINEIIAELRKLKVNIFSKEQHFLTELSKKQKMIFKAFGVNLENIDQYLINQPT